MEYIAPLFTIFGWILAIPLTIYLKNRLGEVSERFRTSGNAVRHPLIAIIYVALVLAFLILAIRLGYVGYDND